MTSVEDLRAQNHETVEKYLHHLCDSPLMALNLLHDDACKELTFATFPMSFKPDNVHPISYHGKEILRENFEFNNKCFKGDLKNRKVYSTQDPNKFFLEAELDGTYILDDKVWPYIQPYYIMVIELRDGLIMRLREVFNPLQLLKTAGTSNPDALLERHRPISQ
ncbi:hypothetical protein PFICI_12738 [Pestalotiopsis fici W106-1]|uniref:SnoaL-like domain-containing protein n=1 Tax=Pestalotiopsis fici (strain W106-1 / CGMCC3.15140) TaxID=1229662 RepID=W3WPT0_PESFW|nr:uncharacterized protein PFICI_12738 [Pestalotiopsis fici W106-1]ETS75794.1 hypothetical protein PFICI_12738 [Pestalotiopsis fici W106-1]